MNPPLKVFRFTVKPQNLLRSLLLVPYFAWGLALLFVTMISAFTRDSNPANAFLDALTGVASIYTIGIVIWGIPYTILVAGLMLWSINKPAPTIFRLLVFSPFLLSILTAFEVGLITFLPLQTPSLAALKDFLAYILITVIPTLLFGYGFVGVCIILYKAMNHLNLIRNEVEAK